MYIDEWLIPWIISVLEVILVITVIVAIIWLFVILEDKLEKNTGKIKKWITRKLKRKK